MTQAIFNLSTPSATLLLSLSERVEGGSQNPHGTGYAFSTVRRLSWRCHPPADQSRRQRRTRTESPVRFLESGNKRPAAGLLGARLHRACGAGHRKTSSFARYWDPSEEAAMTLTILDPRAGQQGPI
jgi:hypothetical protein